MNDFFLIIDGSSLLSTQFFGNLPREVLMGKTVEDKEKFYHKIMQTKAGVYTNGVYGFLRSLFSVLDKQKPKYIAITWDLTRNTFRRKLYSEYKAQRSETIVPLKNQFELCQEVLKRMGISQFMSMDYEADDFSGSLADKFSKEVPVRIMTKDHDYLQLVNENTALFMIMNDQKKCDEYFSKYNINKATINVPDKTILVDEKHVPLEFGVEPLSIPSLKGLMGDSSDNIKGVPGVGDKAAIPLIAYYKSVDSLYNDIETRSDKELSDFWKNELGINRPPYKALTKESDEELVGKKAALLSTTLATIKRDIPLDVTLEELEVNLSYEETVKILNELEFNSLTIPESIFNGEVNDSYFEDYEAGLKVIDNLTLYYDEMEAILAGSQGETIGLNVELDNDDIVSCAISTKNNTFFIKSEGFIYSDLIRELLEKVIDKAELINVFDAKKLLKAVSFDKEFNDLSIISYLINPLDSKQTGEKLAILSGHTPSSKYDDLSLSAYASLHSFEYLYNELNKTELIKVYNDIEKPVIKILDAMEKEGIKVMAEELDRQGNVLKSNLNECEKEIYELAGESFNILSPKQLGVILFEKLGLPGGKKNKTGYSTSAEVLESLVDEHPIVEKILYYRQISKLISTYIEGLKPCIGRDGRIHCSFMQTVTATGRLSCVEPNLQNIPVRDELGRLIRKAFVPKEGYTFVDADYSQIELRIMAHMANDQKLIDDYQNSRDIHRATAASVFGVPYDEVTKKMRSDAKAVNFGIIYGISSFGLGKDLGIGRKQAEEYITSYFKHYPSIKEYLDKCVSKAKKNEHTTTLFGRIRPIPELASSNFQMRSFGERIAMNSPIQGTAADIMKIAMIRVDKALKESGYDAKILLQIHDEILIEANKKDAEAVKELLCKEMTKAADLRVPLIAEGNIADNWYDLK